MTIKEAEQMIRGLGLTPFAYQYDSGKWFVQSEESIGVYHHPKACIAWNTVSLQFLGEARKYERRTK